jgi:transcription elongation factor SPT6
VYTNAAGFIKVLDKYAKRTEDFEVLDSTRIHPDDYNLARKMAADALVLCLLY